MRFIHRRPSFFLLPSCPPNSLKPVQTHRNELQRHAPAALCGPPGPLMLHRVFNGRFHRHFAQAVTVLAGGPICGGGSLPSRGPMGITRRRNRLGKHVPPRRWDAKTPRREPLRFRVLA